MSIWHLHVRLISHWHPSNRAGYGGINGQSTDTVCILAASLVATTTKQYIVFRPQLGAVLHQRHVHQSGTVFAANTGCHRITASDHQPLDHFTILLCLLDGHNFHRFAIATRASEAAPPEGLFWEITARPGGQSANETHTRHNILTIHYKT